MPYRRYDFIHDHFFSLTDLFLRPSNLSALPRPSPAYFLTVVAQNSAGLSSKLHTSDPILVVSSDAAGYVFDGPTSDSREAQVDVSEVTATFEDFRAPLHGIASFQFAVGSEPGSDDLQPFTSDGIVNVNGEARLYLVSKFCL